MQSVNKPKLMFVLCEILVFNIISVTLKQPMHLVMHSWGFCYQVCSSHTILLTLQAALQINHCKKSQQ